MQDPKELSITVIKPFYWNLKPWAIGSKLTVPKLFAIEMVAANKAVYSGDADPNVIQELKDKAEAKAEAKVKKPMEAILPKKEEKK